MKKILLSALLGLLTTTAFAAPYTTFQGGTGTSTAYANRVLIGNTAGTAWTSLATSSLGFPTLATILSSLSNTVTGLTYTPGTGVTSLTAGYVIPLSASTTEWSGFYNTPSTRITAGTNLSWSGNTLNATGVGSGDVVGPSAATSSAVALFSGTTGKLLENSVVTMVDTMSSGVKDYLQITGKANSTAAGGIRLVKTISGDQKSILQFSDSGSDTLAQGRLRFYGGAPGISTTLVGQIQPDGDSFLDSSVFASGTLSRFGIGAQPTEVFDVNGSARFRKGFKDSTNATGTLGQILWSTGTSTLWVATSSLGISGGGITSLAGQTGATQLFASSTTGTDFTITSSGNTHTFNLPSASASARGFVNTTTQAFTGNKFFNGNLENSTDLTVGGSAGIDMTGSELYVSGTVAINKGNSPENFAFRGAPQYSGVAFINLDSSVATAGIGDSFANLTVTADGTVGEASSGNHPLITQVGLKPVRVTAAAATVSDTSTLYIEGSATSTTVTGNNYSLWVDNVGGGGKSRIDGSLALGNELRDSTNVSGASGQILQSTGTSTLWVTNDPSIIPVKTVTDFNATYSDDLSRIWFHKITGASNANNVLTNSYINNGVGQVYSTTSAAQQISTASVAKDNNVTITKGMITYEGFHYAFVGTTTSWSIQRATSSSDTNVVTQANWATSTLSGGGFASTSYSLVGVAANKLYFIATSTALVSFTIATTTNTLTFSATTSIPTASMNVSNTRVNENGIYTSDGGATVAKFNFSGTRVANHGGAAALSTTVGPGIFATKYSIYLLTTNTPSNNTDYQLFKINGF
jgi:hypothetical protein